MDDGHTAAVMIRAQISVYVQLSDLDMPHKEAGAAAEAAHRQTVIKDTHHIAAN